MKTDDITQNLPDAIDFKKLADNIWEWSARSDKNTIQKMRMKGKENDEDFSAYLMRLHYAIRDGVWADSEDLAKQMDLNMEDHHVYIDMDQYFKTLYNK